MRLHLTRGRAVRLHVGGGGVAQYASRALERTGALREQPLGVAEQAAQRSVDLLGAVTGELLIELLDTVGAAAAGGAHAPRPTGGSSQNR